MVRSRILRAAGLTVAAIAFAISAGALPVAQLSVDGGEVVDIPLQTDGKVWFALDEVVSGADWSVEIDVVLDPDPSIVYGIAVQNDSGGDLSFSLLFSQDISLTSTPGTVNTSWSASTTNGGGTAGQVTLTPLSPPVGIGEDGDGNTEIQVYNLSADGGASLFNAGIDLGQLFNSDPTLTSDTAPPENSPLVAGPIGSGVYDHMRVDLNFALSGGGDIVTMNGSARVVPEPAPALLLGIGLVALARQGRRRAR